MIEYRLFFMQDGHVLGAAEFIADADEAAVSHAKTLCAGRDAELWNRARRVQVIPAASAAAGPAPTPATPLPIVANDHPGERLRA